MNDDADWPFPPEWECVEYWEEQVAMAFADALLRKMDAGKIAPPIVYGE